MAGHDATGVVSPVGTYMQGPLVHVNVADCVNAIARRGRSEILVDALEQNRAALQTSLLPEGAIIKPLLNLIRPPPRDAGADRLRPAQGVLQVEVSPRFRPSPQNGHLEGYRKPANRLGIDPIVLCRAILACLHKRGKGMGGPWLVAVSLAGKNDQVISFFQTRFGRRRP